MAELPSPMLQSSATGNPKVFHHSQRSALGWQDGSSGATVVSTNAVVDHRRSLLGSTTASATWSPPQQQAAPGVARPCAPQLVAPTPKPVDEEGPYALLYASSPATMDGGAAMPSASLHASSTYHPTPNSTGTANGALHSELRRICASSVCGTAAAAAAVQRSGSSAAHVATSPTPSGAPSPLPPMFCPASGMGSAQQQPAPHRLDSVSPLSAATLQGSASLVETPAWAAGAEAPICTAAASSFRRDGGHRAKTEVAEHHRTQIAMERRASAQSSPSAAFFTTAGRPHQTSAPPLNASYCSQPHNNPHHDDPQRVTIPPPASIGSRSTNSCSVGGISCTSSTPAASVNHTEHTKKSRAHLGPWCSSSSSEADAASASPAEAM